MLDQVNYTKYIVTHLTIMNPNMRRVDIVKLMIQIIDCYPLDEFAILVFVSILVVVMVRRPPLRC